MEADFQADVEAIQRIGAVSSILQVVCRTTGMGFAAVARVTESRWIACGVHDEIAFGLVPGAEIDVKTTICQTIHQNHQTIVIDHVAEDATFGHHPTPALYGFESYISTPILLPDGTFFGTLCAIDPAPRRLKTPEVTGMFKLFAELIGFHIDGIRQLQASEAKLLDERNTSVLREQFIAVLGHDLRNPLASISAGVRTLSRRPLDAKATMVVGLIQGSVVRMAGLIDNVMDFARGRLGGGLKLDRSVMRPLEPVLHHVVDEMQIIDPTRKIETEFVISAPVDCDQPRIAQLFSNLLGNALTHGSADSPIMVRAITAEGMFELSVANAGEPIPADAMDRLFQPFYRRAIGANQQGLGLGLYIASEIAKAHGGTLSVASDQTETRFVLRMALRCA